MICNLCNWGSCRICYYDYISLCFFGNSNCYFQYCIVIVYLIYKVCLDFEFFEEEEIRDCNEDFCEISVWVSFCVGVV